jgi:hypothetical protein
MRRIVTLALLFGLCSACSSNNGGDDPTTESTDGTSDGTSDNGGGTAGTDGHIHDTAVSDDGISDAEAAAALSRAECNYVGACAGFETLGVSNYVECVELKTTEHLAAMAGCDVILAEFYHCIIVLEEADDTCADPQDACDLAHMCA